MNSKHKEKTMPANLLLHCGASAVGRDTLAVVPTPQATPPWQPIPHIDLLETVEGVLDSAGLRVAQAAHGITHDGARYFGLLEVANGHDDTEYARVLGVRNSHDKRFPAGVCAGSQVLICDNLAFCTDGISVARKHTRFVLRDLPYLVREAIGRLLGAWKRQDDRISAYKERRVSDTGAHDLTIGALDAGVISASRIPDVIQEWRDPSHEAFRPRNVWSWFNSVTEALKGGNIQTLPKKTQALHALCDARVGLN